MTTKTVNFSKLQGLLEGCPLVQQQYRFPNDLLSYEYRLKENTKTTSNYNFVMSLDEFNKTLKHMFDEKETTYYTETFYDTDSVEQNEVL